MKVENHYKRLKENIDVLNKNLKKSFIDRQSTIAFSISAASIHMIEIFFHESNLVDYSFIIKHEWFKSKHKLDEKLRFNFPKKQEILELMKYIHEPI